MKLAHSKKGLSAALMAIIGLILAAIIIAPFAVFSGGILDILSGGPGDQSITSFSEVLNSVELLVKNKDVTWCYVPDVQPDGDFVIAGFNKGDLSSETDSDLKNVIEESCGIIKSNLNKPKSCSTQACLCLCDGGWGDASGDDCEGDYCSIIPDVNRFVMSKGRLKFDLVVTGKHCGGFELGAPRTIILLKSLDDEKEIDLKVLDDDEGKKVKMNNEYGLPINPCSELAKKEDKSAEDKEEPTK